MITFKFQVKQVYGKNTIYPACEKSHEFCKLWNTKTFTKNMLDVLKLLDVKYVILAQEL